MAQQRARLRAAERKILQFQNYIQANIFQDGANAVSSQGGEKGLSSAGRGSGRRGAAGIRGGSTTTAAASTGVGVCNTTLGVVEGSRSDGLNLGGVNTESEPGEDTILDAITEQGVPKRD